MTRERFRPGGTEEKKAEEREDGVEEEKREKGSKAGREEGLRCQYFRGQHLLAWVWSESLPAPKHTAGTVCFLID